jgi:hypothetical protein
MASGDPSSSSSGHASQAWIGPKLNLDDSTTHSGWFNILKTKVCTSNFHSGPKFVEMMDEHDGLPAHIKEIMVDWSNLLNRKYKPCSAPQTINALSNAVVSASAAAVPIATGSNNNASRRKKEIILPTPFSLKRVRMCRTQIKILPTRALQEPRLGVARALQIQTTSVS